MRLLFESQSSTDLSLAKELLEENGIPVFISSEQTFQLKPSLVLHRKGLWICLDEQFSDAAKLLKNPSHAVSKPVDVVAFHFSLGESQRCAAALSVPSGSRRILSRDRPAAGKRHNGSTLGPYPAIAGFSPALCSPWLGERIA